MTISRSLRQARRSLPRQRYRLLIAVSAALLLAATVVAPLVGSTHVDLARALAHPFDWQTNTDAAILFVARVPRVLLAGLVGGSLALCGVIFQALLRNPLATPYTLGVSAGATLGAFLGLRWVPAGTGSALLVPACGLLGATLTTLLVFLLAARRGRMPTSVLLLAGVTLNYTLGALVLLLQYFSDYTETARMVRWMMGDLEGVGFGMLALLAAGILPGVWLLSRRGLALNLLSLGEQEAACRGVPVQRMTIRSLLWAAWITGLVVSVAGPIGFVGIIVPHALRLVGGFDHRVILPASVLAGAGFLMLSDAVARTIIAPVELPIGVLTAALGGPFFLLLLLRQRQPI